jgi:flagellar hook-basal body complex protein FliE
MSIEAISGLGMPAVPVESVRPIVETPASFANFLTDAVQGLDASVKSADQQIRVLAAGGDIQVHDVMISLEEARMQMMLAVEVRNRFVEAYQELMRMQL